MSLQELKVNIMARAIIPNRIFFIFWGFKSETIDVIVAKVCFFLDNCKKIKEFVKKVCRIVEKTKKKGLCH